MTQREALKRSLWSGLAWGFAEGMFFFLVPDILLCYWAIRHSWKSALASTLAVVAGAMLAAALLYPILGFYPSAYHALHHLWELLPGFRPKMVSVAATHLQTSGAAGLLSGPASGIPYRVYALEAWKAGLSLQELLLWTPIARLERIVIAPLVCLGLRGFLGWALVKKFRSCQERELERTLLGITFIYWVGVYVWYWGKFLPQTYP